MSHSMNLRHFVWLGMACIAGTARVHAGVNYEEAPIFYSSTAPENRVSRLQQRLAAGEVTLRYDDPQGYLRSVLHELEIPVTSQVLVFSKTSLQKDHVGPGTPRAIYFNDDVHLGYVQQGVIEIAVTDPRLGMAFYTLEQSPDQPVEFRQRTNNCLTCHSTGRTRNVAGLQVRSVLPDPEGQPVIAAGSFLSTHASPLSQRWGGWYVTGKHGAQQHLGNFTLTDGKKPKNIENPTGQNVTDLSSRFDTTKYLAPHSDIVALLVLEHQTDAHNFLTLANYEARHALHVQESQLKEPNASAEEIRKATRGRIEKAGDALLRYLLFSGEARLNGRVEGTSEFAKEFAACGPRDRRGRSLRDFDLSTRVFKHPCSYLIYSDAFDALPQEMKAYVYQRLRFTLTNDESTPDFAHLSLQDRLAILEILLETKHGFEKTD